MSPLGPTGQDSFLGKKSLISLPDKEKTNILQKAHSILIPSLSDKVLMEVAKVKVWLGFD